MEESKYLPLPRQTAYIGDWEYPMRRTMQEVVPGLFLGPYASAAKSQLEGMKSAGLTHVVCVRTDVERMIIRANHPTEFQYLEVEVKDDPFSCIIPQLKSAIQFIDFALKNGGKVLVHGNVGNSRAPAIVTGYLMSTYGLTFDLAMKYVMNARGAVCVNDGFVHQLKDFEMVLKAENALYGLMEIEGNAENKRKAEEEAGGDAQKVLIRSQEEEMDDQMEE